MSIYIRLENRYEETGLMHTGQLMHTCKNIINWLPLLVSKHISKVTGLVTQVSKLWVYNWREPKQNLKKINKIVTYGAKVLFPNSQKRGHG